ncbi:MAG: hypothetical protein FWG23_08175 [Eggerthellaceae bacterium]|nr:hypothetical protein [Eggerthellaceae bacterium]
MAIASAQGDRPPPKRGAKEACRLAAERLHVGPQARHAWAQARRLYYSVARSESNRVLDGVRAQVDEGLERLGADELAPRRGVLLVEGMHPDAYRAVSAISNAMPDCGWAYLTTREVQDRLGFPVYPVPHPLERGRCPGSAAFTYGGAFLRQARSDGRVGGVVLERIRKSYPRMGRGYPEFFACEVVRYYECALRRLAPRLVLVWNQHQAKGCIIGAIARGMGIPVAYMESGEYPGTVAIDGVGLFGGSRAAREPGWFATLPVTDGEARRAEGVIAYLRRSGANRYPQALGAGPADALARLDRGRPTVLFAGDFDVENGIYPMTGDSRELYSPLFDSSHRAMLSLAVLAGENGWNLAYRPHPLTTRYEPAGRPENVIFAGEGNVNELVDMADLVVVITTSLAYTALIRGKPALTLGYTTLRGKGCAYEAFTMDAVEPAVREALGRGLTEGQRQAFVRHTARMLRYCLFDNQSDRPFRYGRSVEEAAQYLRGIIEGEGGRP